MPIRKKGKLSLHSFKYILKNMPVKDEGFFDIDYSKPRESFFYVSHNTPIISIKDWEENYKDDDGEAYVKIRRIGAGLTEKDFVLDFSFFEDFELCLCIDEFNEELYIAFPCPYEIKVTTQKQDKGLKGKPMEILKTELQEALDEDSTEGYEKAAKIRNEIERRTGKKDKK